MNERTVSWAMTVVMGGDATSLRPSAHHDSPERSVRRTTRHVAGTTPATDLHTARTLHPRWEEVADRCLACGNCTAVCPTCFCTDVEDTTDLSGTVRSSGTSRYRQWMTHKLSTWVDQFDSSGCVGCGRCITWCPVAIDITEEVVADHLRELQLG